MARAAPVPSPSLMPRSRSGSIRRLAAALAWNEAIQSLFSFLFPKTNGIIGKFVYAAVITAVVVLITLQLKKIADQNNKKKE